MDEGTKRRASVAVEAVVSDTDLVALILATGIGPTSFLAAGLVCKAWLRVCRTEERILRGAALYQGALTKGALMKLFAIPSKVADELPRSSHKRYGGGRYFLYREDAINAVLAAGGMKAWQKRLRSRGEHACVVGWRPRPERSFCQEERLHARAVKQRVC